MPNRQRQHISIETQKKNYTKLRMQYGITKYADKNSLRQTTVPSWSCSKAVYKPVWRILLLSVQWINFWWWTEKLYETCRVSCQNKFLKLVHLSGFIIMKFVTMHGHMDVKEVRYLHSCSAIWQKGHSVELMRH